MWLHVFVTYFRSNLFFIALYKNIVKGRVEVYVRLIKIIWWHLVHLFSGLNMVEEM